MRRFLAGPAPASSDQEERLAFGRYTQDSILGRAGEIEEIGSLENECGIDVGAAEPGLQADDPAFDFASG
jgi:hypothetical protein